MPNRSKQKGDRAEKQIVDILRSYGLDAYRIPLSGAVTGFKSDVELRHSSGNLKIESKVRARGFIRLYKWLADNDALMIKADRAEPLIVLDFRRFCRLIAGNAHSEAGNGTDKLLDEAISDKPSIESHPALNSVDPVTINDLSEGVRVSVGPRTIA